MRKKSTLQQQLYTVAFVDLSIKSILTSSRLFRIPEWLDTIFILIFLGCIGWKLLLQKYTKKMLFGTLFFGIIFVFISVRMKYFFLLFTFCGIAGMQNIDLKKVLRYTSVTKILLILAHVVPYIMAVIFSPEEIEYFYRNGVQRHGFYIGHSNTFSMYVCWALLELTFAFYKELRIVHLFAFWLINGLVYRFTDSNTSIIISTFCFLAFILERIKPKLMAKILTPIAQYLYAVLAIFFTAITIWFSKMPATLKSLYLILNNALTGRLLFGSFTYDHFGIAWIGNPNVHLDKTTYYQGFWVDSLVFDCTYIYLLVYYGAVFLFIFSIAFIWIGRDKEKKNDRNLMKIFIIAYALFAVMENYANNAALCFPILFVGERIYQIYNEKMEQKRRIRSKL